MYPVKREEKTKDLMRKGIAKKPIETKIPLIDRDPKE